jgi:hypothetical protein
MSPSGGTDTVPLLVAQVEVSGETPALRDVWEATSFELEKLQSAEATRAQEQAGLKARTAPKWDLTYTPVSTPRWRTEIDNKHKVRVCAWWGRTKVRKNLTKGRKELPKDRTRLANTPSVSNNDLSPPLLPYPSVYR